MFVCALAYLLRHFVTPDCLKRAVSQRLLVDAAPRRTLPIQLYWHCWKLESDVLDALTAALTHAAAQSLVR